MICIKYIHVHTHVHQTVIIIVAYTNMHTCMRIYTRGHYYKKITENTNYGIDYRNICRIKHTCQWTETGVNSFHGIRHFPNSTVRAILRLAILMFHHFEKVRGESSFVAFEG